MFCLSSTTVWDWFFLDCSKWCFWVVLSTNGSDESPNIRRVNCGTTVSNVSRPLIKWNLIASCSSLLILVCRKACSKYHVIATGFKQNRVSTYQSIFRNARISNHSFKDGLVFVGVADAWYTIWSLLVLADCFTTGFCGMQNSFNVVIAGTFSMILCANLS